MQTPSKHKNVVPLKTDNKTSSAVAALARMPAPMHILRDKMRHALQGYMHALFDKADDALFELADQATNNQEQNLYFDSMREVRLHRRNTESNFFRYLDIGFARLLGVDAYIEDAEIEITSLDDLALIDNDEQEEIIASETMITRSNEKFANKFEYLSLRIGHLMPVKVEGKRLPISSNSICDAFVQSTKSVSIDIKAKLVLFKLFDRLVMAELGNMYDTLNQLLIEADVLPSLHSPVQESAPRARSERRSSQRSSMSGRRRGDVVDDDTSQFLNTLRDLLETNVGAPPQVVEHQAQVAESALSSQDLMSLLSLTQQQSIESTGNLISTEASATQDVGALVALLQQRSGTSAQKLDQVDEDVINLVSMMFDFILEDRNLAPSMKAQLARLQIPMIKVAIADKSFFGKGGHPARRLLNEMAMSVLGWQDPGEERRARDGLYKKIDETVQKILTDFASDVSIFEALLLDFMAYQEKEKRRAKILMQRTIDAEGGKAKSECARSDVDTALQCLTEGVELPAAAQNILTGAWANVLFISRLKDEGEGSDWQEHIQTAEDLVWSASAQMNASNKKKLLKLVPSLLGRLRKGLENIAYNPYEQGQLFKALEQLHIQKLRKAVPPVVTERAATEKVTEVESKTEVEKPVAAEKSESSATTSPRNAQEVEREASTQKAEAPQADEQHLALVSNLRQGGWFEMTEAGGEVYTCRLAAIIKPTGKYIFVNRAGMKVAEESREDLALALKVGSLRILDDTMLFDRALESVISNLRESRPSQPVT